MELEHISLARQMDMVFRELSEELKTLTSGTAFVQIRHDTIGKFGVRHNPIECHDSQEALKEKGLNAEQVKSFRNMAIAALSYKKGWTHGEICFDFTIRQKLLVVSAQFESHYNMANVMTRLKPRNSYLEKHLDS